MTPLKAAKTFKAMLVKKYGKENTEELTIWNKKKCIEMGYGSGDAAIIWNSGPYDWAITESMTDFAFGLDGVLAEPWNGAILNFYKNG